MRALFACVGENRPDWFRKIHNLVLSVRTFGGSLADAPFVVHLVGGADDEHRTALEALGAEVRVVEPVDPRLVNANKLRMFELADRDDFDVLVGLDCDVVVMGDLAPELDPVALRALPAGQTHLADEGWERLYAALGVPLPAKDVVTTVSGERTYPYLNSGVLFVPRAQCGPLGEHWRRHLSWLLDGAADELGLGRIKRDQIPFACALATTGIPVRPLPVNLNLSTVQPRYADAYRHQWGPPFVFHYHRAIDEHGFLQPTLHREVNTWLDRFNRARAEATGLAYAGLPPLPLATRLKALARKRSWYRPLRRRLSGR